MRRIPLSKGAFALVDDEDYPELIKRSWYLGSHGYAVRKTHTGRAGDGTRKEVIFLMHRVINNTPDGLQTDHINRNRLDNRRANLRTVTSQENKFNASIMKNNTSGHKGVSFHKANKSWSAYITRDYKRIFLGYYKNLSDAVSVRQRAEKDYHKI